MNFTPHSLIFSPGTPISFQETNAFLYNFYNILFFVETSLLVVFFAVGLYFALKGTKQPFATKMCALMFTSNVCILVSILAFKICYKVIVSDGKLSWWQWLFAIIALITFIASDACFNIATWLLAYNYYICADKLEDVHHIRKTDANMLRRERNQTILFWAILAVNVIISVLWGCFRFGLNFCRYE